MLNVKQGAKLRVRVEFTNSDTAALVDPDHIFFQWRSAVLAVLNEFEYGVDSELVRETGGTYYLDIDTTESGGQYQWWFYSTGGGQGATDGIFYAKPNLLSNPS